MKRGLVVAALHIAIVLSLAAKYTYDRQTLPRVWARTVPFDPDLPLRGRYVRLAVEARPITPVEREHYWGRGSLFIEGGELKVAISDNGPVQVVKRGELLTVADALAYFIPEHVPDPSIRPAGEELWVEVSVPPKAPPRPIRLGVKKNGQITPLALR